MAILTTAKTSLHELNQLQPEGGCLKSPRGAKNLSHSKMVSRYL